ncbi:MAG: hypothetical protein RLP44_02560 [Aggregatilineales bacterium]
MSTHYTDSYATDEAIDAANLNLRRGALDEAIYNNAVAIAASGFNPASLTPQARLSLSSTLAVTTADVTAATTLYLHPFRGSFVPIYDGANWQARALSAAVSIAIPATTSTVYDVYAYWTGAAIALELVAWSSGTARATALTTQDGINVKTGDTTRRYMGTIRTTTVSGQCEDSLTSRFLWNMYNRHPRALERQDSTASWVYTIATYRQANANTANRVQVVLGLSEDIVDVEVMIPSVSTAFNAVGVGLDSTTVNSAGLQTNSATHFCVVTARYKNFPGIGYHALNWIELGGSSGTTTWFGPGGISGTVWA